MKHISLSAFLVAASLTLVTGCSPSAPAPGGTPNGGTVPVAPTAGKADIGKMTDDLWVEMYAQEIYHSSPELSAAWDDGGRDRMLDQNGITIEQLAAYGRQVNGDVDRASAMIDRADKRIKELQAGK